MSVKKTDIYIYIRFKMKPIGYFPVSQVVMKSSDSSCDSGFYFL